MHLGIFGGSFDPVHYGHLLLAECCREQVPLDEVHFMPAGVPPHKRGRELSAARHRVEMLRLAIGGHEAFAVSTLEIDRGGVTYTYETLQTLHAQRPGDELFFLMGADSLHDLPSWREPERICELATPVVVNRPGSPSVDLEPLRAIASAERLQAMQQCVVEMPQIELSSTDIRQRSAAGQSIRYRTPMAVAKYIEGQGLYAEVAD